MRCSEEISCQEPGEICNTFDGDCYAANGKCANDGDCPIFSSEIADISELKCVQGFCRLLSKQAQALEAFSDVQRVQVHSPIVGQVFENEERVTFSWINTGTPVILLVLDNAPSGIADLMDSALWGMTLKAGEEPLVKWSSGSKISGEVTGKQRWTKPPDPAPHGTTLYFLAQAVSKGKLAAASRLIPFQIVSTWLESGEPCQEPGIPGSCVNRAIPLTCYYNKCRRLCASHEDCRVEGNKCGPLKQGARHCE